MLSDAARMTERFTRVDYYDQSSYEVTIDDAKVFAKPLINHRT